MLSIPYKLWAGQLPEGFVEEQVATNLNPTTMALAPDGRIFIAEKNGAIRIVRDDVLLTAPFLSVEVDDYNERGLCGITFHPEFEQNNLVYLFYTVPGGNYNRITRVTANGDFAVPGSEEIILELDPLSGTIHNGGAMHFGSDGKLYIATGDGSLPDNAQALDNLLGKILRINEDGSIPADNPFYNQTTGVYRSIYAVGFRNPFTLAIQPGSGRFFVNDVGSEFYEEVNAVVAGGNYGWSFIEGIRTFETEPPNYQDPVYAYGHDAGCAIMGAAFYNPLTATFPEEYHGKYFFGDYCDGYIKVLNPDNGEVESVFASGINRPINMVFAPNGDMYYLERAGMGGGSQQDNTSTADGALWRVRYTGSGAPVISVQPQSVLLPVGEDATFSVQVSGNQPISYQWFRDGLAMDAETGSSLIVLNVGLGDSGSSFQVRVSNSEGMVLSMEAILTVTSNTRPMPVILEPEDGLLYQAGDTIFFSGIANDNEDGAIGTNDLTWRVDFHHDAHTHPILTPISGIDEGFVVIPLIGEIDDNVWLRIYLSATDSEGLQRQVFKEVFPEKTTFVVQTEPPGLDINIDGRIQTTPSTTTSVKGLRRTLSAPLQQLKGEKIFTFEHWTNDWEPQFYTFFAGEIDTITAFFSETNLSIGNGTGLLGRYFQGPQDIAFSTPAVLTRIDPIIDFNWDGGAPDMLLEPDFFTIRWSGEVMPIVGGPIIFHTITDDGVRLWVNEELIIDQWVPQAATEVTATITLEAGQRYPIQMEYYEEGGAAVASLLWSSPVLPKQLIPTIQLFPDEILDFPEDYQLSVYPSPASDFVNLEVKTKREDGIRYFIYDISGRLVFQGQMIAPAGKKTIVPIDISTLASGIYVVQFRGVNFIEGSFKLSVF